MPSLTHFHMPYHRIILLTLTILYYIILTQHELNKQILLTFPHIQSITEITYKHMLLKCITM